MLGNDEISNDDDDDDDNNDGDDDSDWDYRVFLIFCIYEALYSTYIHSK